MIILIVSLRRLSIFLQNKLFNRHLLIAFVLVFLLQGCSREPDPSISFYFWKTNCALSPVEQKALSDNNVKRLYIRYFDVDFDLATDTVAHPIGVITFNRLPKQVEIVPVVYIKNRTFENTASENIGQLSLNVAKLIQEINDRHQIQCREVQFDCDWTGKTKEKFFRFIKQYEEQTHQIISATIRLHQIKYSDRTGIPPVSRGVLMYYNMGKIDAGKGNSIYDPKTAAQYIESLKNYPLQIDIALPIFAWGIQIRDKNVVQLLNKMNESHFADSTFFIPAGNNRYKVIKPCFRGGYYFKENDEIKIESISASDLEDMSRNLHRYLKETPQEIIFYDLDTCNIQRYEQTIFQEIVHRF